MQRQHQRLLLVCVALLAAPASACDKDGSSEQPASEAGSATPAASEAASTEQAKPAGEATHAATAPEQAAMSSPDQTTCPMWTEGAVVDVLDVPDGVALEFTTASGDVDELRNRVQHMASMYEMHAGRGSMMWHHSSHMGHGGHMRGGDMQPGMGSPMPPATATAEPTDNGARLVLRPRDPSQLDALREQVRDHQKRMSAGECWAPHAGPGA